MKLVVNLVVCAALILGGLVHASHSHTHNHEHEHQHHQHTNHDEAPLDVADLMHAVAHHTLAFDQIDAHGLDAAQLVFTKIMLTEHQSAAFSSTPAPLLEPPRLA